MRSASPKLVILPCVWRWGQGSFVAEYDGIDVVVDVSPHTVIVPHVNEVRLPPHSDSCAVLRVGTEAHEVDVFHALLRFKP